MSYEHKNFGSLVSQDILLGRGAYGEVYGPREWKGKICAIKKLFQLISKDEAEKGADKELSACRKMMALQHTHLITVYDVSVEPPALYIMMEYAGGGTLRKVLSGCKFHLPLDILKDWGIQVAEGMAFLHENYIVHRDLKSPNIVLMESDASSNPYEKTLKITDFDLIREHDGTQTMSFAGTYAYMAPEVLTEQRFSKASDVWSYGVVLWEILTKDVPFKGLSYGVLYNGIPKGQLKLEIPDSCPDIINVVMSGCLRTGRGKRPSFNDILTMLQTKHSGKHDAQQKDQSQSTSSVARPSSTNFIRKITGETENVFGVTKLKTEIYILCHAMPSPNVIYVYEDRYPFGIQRKMKIKEIKYPVDIGSDENKNCLYVSDFQEKCVWKVTGEIEPGAEHMITKWVSTNYEPHSLSVSNDGRLLVVDMYWSILHIYKSDAQHIRSIDLPRDIENTRHAVETSDGNFIIIHQWVENVGEGESGSSGREGKPNWTISEVTSDGKMIRSFNPSNKTQELLDPKHLSLDDDDRVFVADNDNHGVVLFDSLLKWNRSICPTNEVNEEIVQWPQRLCYDEGKKQLIVGGKGATVYTLNIA